MAKTITFPTTPPVSILPGEVITVSTASGTFLVNIQCDKVSDVLFHDADGGVLASGNIANGPIKVTLPKANSNLVVDTLSSATILLSAVAMPDDGVKALITLDPTGILGVLSPGSLYQVNVNSRAPYTCIIYSLGQDDSPIASFPVVHGDCISLPGPNASVKLVSEDPQATVCIQKIITNPKAVS